LLRLVRNPDLLLCWSGAQLLISDLSRGTRIRAPANIVAVLDVFGPARGPERGTKARDPKGTLSRVARRLRRLGLLLPVAEARRRPSRLRAWKENLASAFYHVASRDVRYIQSPTESDIFLRQQVVPRRRPALFKRYRSRPRVALPIPASSSKDAAALARILAARRTVRRFAPRPVTLDDLAAVVRGTWGRTGWLDARYLGRLPTKTSPSAGALHPIECYVLAWNVRGLSPGLYHYDVAGDDLRRLRSGDLRRRAVRIASGQQWVGRAGFLCVMTAVFGRTLWKYHLENAYRSLWLDAGHLAQTFCLLATARGLGPFTTAAIQDSDVERVLALDGVTEFPLYLCGAGVPART
jgi:SagB-type dehydrogenase family enzyme